MDLCQIIFALVPVACEHLYPLKFESAVRLALCGELRFGRVCRGCARVFSNVADAYGAVWLALCVFVRVLLKVLTTGSLPTRRSLRGNKLVVNVVFHFRKNQPCGSGFAPKEQGKFAGGATTSNQSIATSRPERTPTIAG